MTKTPNHSAFATANNIMVRYEQTIDTLITALSNLQQTQNLSDEMTFGFPWGANNPLAKNICVFIGSTPSAPIIDPESAQPTTALQRLRRMAHNTTHAKQTPSGGWAHIALPINGDIKIKTGKHGESFLNLDDALTLNASIYQNPTTITAQILLTMAQHDQTQDRILSKAILNALGHKPQKHTKPPLN